MKKNKLPDGTFIVVSVSAFWFCFGLIFGYGLSRSILEFVHMVSAYVVIEFIVLLSLRHYNKYIRNKKYKK